MLMRRPIRIRCTSPRMTTHHPDAALLADLDVADDLGAVVDEGGGMDAGQDVPGRAEAFGEL